MAPKTINRIPQTYSGNGFVVCHDPNWYKNQVWNDYVPLQNYPPYIPTKIDDVPQLLDPATAPHPTHLKSEFSTLIAKIQASDLPSPYNKSPNTLHLRKVKNSERYFTIFVTPMGNPIPTPQDITHQAHQISLPERKITAKKIFNSLLTQPENVYMVFANYMAKVNEGDSQILKDAVTRIAGIPDEEPKGDDADSIKEALSKLSTNDILAELNKPAQELPENIEPEKEDA